MFRAEGVKLVKDILSSGGKLKYIFSTDEHLGMPPNVEQQFIKISASELQKISLLSTPNKVIAVFEIPTEARPAFDAEITLALDEINDPGNLGTIIRLADWFGVKEIICSLNTVDVYNPKVVQSTMGSGARGKVCYGDLKSWMEEAKSKGITLSGTFMNGKSVYSIEKRKRLLVMGNEANGVSPEIETYLDEKITIPSFTADGPESLNVAMATGIIVSQLAGLSLK